MSWGPLLQYFSREKVQTLGKSARIPTGHFALIVRGYPATCFPFCAWLDPDVVPEA